METFEIYFISISLSALVIGTAVFVYIREKRGLAGKPFKNPSLEKARLGFNKVRILFSVAIILFFIGAIVIGVVSAVWDKGLSSGILYHTERVITDMNPQWLDKELNSCVYETVPGQETALLNCSTSLSTRNIPVKFYGLAATEVEKKKPLTVEWKCVRDGDSFTCSDSKILSPQP